MAHEFDPGYGAEPFATLCREYPGPETYPPADFRVEWGPVFHRGRLDGSARVLVLGQDPSVHEAVTRRILIGIAGQRAQGFLAKLGLTASYVMVNTFLYGVYGQRGGEKRVADPGIAAYRNRWLDALLVGTGVEAVVAFGHLADAAFIGWRATPAGQGYAGAYESIPHPTYPESSAHGDPAKAAAATRRMLREWNEALARLSTRVAHADVARPLVPYGDAFAPDDTPPIPAADLPAGLPTWMGALPGWADRVGSTPDEKRATIVVTAPKEIWS